MLALAIYHDDVPKPCTRVGSAHFSLIVALAMAPAALSMVFNLRTAGVGRLDLLLAAQHRVPAHSSP